MSRERHGSAIVVGSGPNGLSAAIALAREGIDVTVLEAKETIGGGARTEALTLSGFVHDVCSAIHPMAAISPFFRELALEDAGLSLIKPPLPVVHAFEDGRVVALHRNLTAMEEELGPDGPRWIETFAPFVESHKTLFRDALRPIRLPDDPVLMARFGLVALRSCRAFVDRFDSAEARALFAGCAAHAMAPLDRPGTAAIGMMLAIAGHTVNWPVAREGSSSITRALTTRLTEAGGTIETGRMVRSLDELDWRNAIIFDLTPQQIVNITGSHFPARYRRALSRYRYGPGAFKIDWALDGPIPWKNPRCLESATVHLGGSFEQIAAAENDAWNGRHSETPFILVAQQSLFDDSRAPEGKQTGWAYCHVPHGSGRDMTDVVESVIERYAPGFRDRILARHAFDTRALERHNPNMIGGDIGGGANTLPQTIARPVIRYDPYSTPDSRLFIGSSSTPPGGGVHGMAGFNAARSVLRNVFGIRPGSGPADPQEDM